MTVEADPVRVESRLVAGQVDCPCCPGVLRPWGWARPRGVHGIDGVRRPRRARCGQCLVTHVLLPVTVLLRRAYAAEVIGAALLARAAGKGHRSIGAALKVPAATVRGWLRVMAGRLDLARVHLLQVAHRAGVDITVPEALRLSVAGSAGRVGCGDCGADRPVRSGRGARPGDGVAGRRGVFGWSAPGTRLARGRSPGVGNTSRP